MSTLGTLDFFRDVSRSTLNVNSSASTSVIGLENNQQREQLFSFLMIYKIMILVARENCNKSQAFQNVRGPQRKFLYDVLERLLKT